jgi:acetyl esterase/lipase
MQVIEIWPGKVPGDFGTFPPERVRDPEDAPTKDAKWITNVTKPTISVFRPPKKKDTGAAVVICPGGGYWNLAFDLEGTEVAAWLNSIGITGIVLKYRVPRREGQVEELPAPGPLLDAQRAVSLVRSKAEAWNIDPKRIGIMGFSAGGHLALTTATHFYKRAYDPVDEIDKVSCRPDFAVAAYSGYLVALNTETLAPYIQIPTETPPIFLLHSTDDNMAKVENTAVMYLALKRAGVSVEMHLYASGGHSYGVRKTGQPTWGAGAPGSTLPRREQPSSTWPDRCADWMRTIGVLKSAAKA